MAMTMTKTWIMRMIAVIISMAMAVVMLPTNITYAASGVKLTVNNHEEGAILKWTEVEGADEYAVYCAADENGQAGEFLNLSCICDGEGRTYTDGDIIPGEIYYYKVIAIADDGEVVSETNTVKYLAKLFVPYVHFSYTKASTGNPVLEWSENVDKADRYQVWRSTTKKGNYTKVAVTTKTKYTDKKAKTGKRYYYKVKAICDANSKVNSAFSDIVSVKKVKGDKAMAKAIDNVPGKKVYTLGETLSIVSKTDVRDIVGFNGLSLCVEGKLSLRRAYDFDSIIKRGGTIKNTGMGLGTAYYGSLCVQPQKNKVIFQPLNIRTYGINTFKVKKNASQKQIIKEIKRTVRKYYPASKWTVSVEKYKASKKKFKGEVNDMKVDYNWAMKKCGYKKYQSDKYKYVLTIKSKTNKKKQGWAFVTVIPK